MLLARLFIRCLPLCMGFAVLSAPGCSDLPDSANETPPASVSAPIGVKGGSLHASGVTLDIPEGALDETVRISATNLGKTAPSTVRARALSDVYEFGPDGTKFNKDVSVTFPNKTQNERAEVYFTKEDGSGFEVIKSERQGTDVVAKVKHFSQGFLGVPMDDEPDADTALPDADLPDASDMDAGSELDASGLDADAGSSMDAQPVPDTSTVADAGVGEASAPDSSGAKVRIVVNTRDVYGALVNQTWAAFQDGNGAWQALPTPATQGVYEFDVAGPVFGVALVCASSDQQNSWGTLRYTTTSAGTLLELGTPGSVCTAGTPVQKHTLAGLLTVPSGYWYWRYGHAHQYSGTNFSTVNPTFMASEFVHDELNDVAFATGPGTDSMSIGRIGLRRDVRPTADMDAGFNFDLVDGGVPPQGTAQAQVMGNQGDAGTVDVHYLTRATEIGIWLNTSQTSGGGVRSASFATLPESIRRSTDLYLLRGEEDLTTQWRRVSFTTYPSGPLTVSLPPMFPVSFSAVGSPYLRPTFVFTQVTGASKYALSMVYSPLRTSNHLFDIEIEPAYLDPPTQVMYTFPDFSQVAGFNPAWVAPNPGSVSLKAAVYKTTANASATTKTESGQSGSVQVP